MITYLKGSDWRFFRDFRGKIKGVANFLRSKTNKFGEIEQLAHVNLIVIMLKSLLYTNTGILIIFGAIRTGPPNRWALVVRNCSQQVYHRAETHFAPPSRSVPRHSQ